MTKAASPPLPDDIPDTGWPDDALKRAKGTGGGEVDLAGEDEMMGHLLMQEGMMRQQLGLPYAKQPLALAFALAAAPFRRRRPPPGAGAVAGEGRVERGEAGAGGSSSTSSFAINLPPLVVKVKDAHPPSSLVCRRSFSSSPSIFAQNLNKRNWQSSKKRVLSLSWFNFKEYRIKSWPYGYGKEKLSHNPIHTKDVAITIIVISMIND